MDSDNFSVASTVAVTLDSRSVKKRIALIVLATDHTTELDFTRLCDPQEVGIYVNRIDYQNPGTKENLLATGSQLTDAATQILPGEKVDVIAYSCTAASVVLGNESVGRLLNKGKPDTVFVTPSSAAINAFHALKADNISVLTPYSGTVSNEILEYFSSQGLHIINGNYLGVDDDRDIARMSENTIIEAACAAMDKEADALFISCTALRAVACIERIEARIGKPVVTSNQAMIWRCLHQIGYTKTTTGYGSLFNY